MEPPSSITCLQPIPRLTPSHPAPRCRAADGDRPPSILLAFSAARSRLARRVAARRACMFWPRAAVSGQKVLQWASPEFGAGFSRKIGLLGPSSCNARSKRAFLRLLSICKAGLVRKDCTKLTVTLQKYPHRLLQPSFLIFKARHVALAIPLRCQTCLRGRRGAEIGPRSRHAAAAPGLRLAGLRPGTGGAGSGASSWQT